MKQCRKCGEWKAYEEYHRDRTRGDGVHPYCKACIRIISKRYYAQNRDKAAEQNRQWHKLNRERQAEYNQQYYNQNREMIAEAQRQYRKQNREKLNEYHRQWREQNREKSNEYWRQWREQNPDKVAEYSRRRRAREANASGDFTHKQWLELCEMHGNRCLCCGEREKRLHADHVVPLSKGGSNDIGNIQPLCGFCNSSKGTKVIDYRLEFEEGTA